MDDTTRDSYLALLACAGVHTDGLGALLRDCGSPVAAQAAGGDRLAVLPAPTRNALSCSRSLSRAAAVKTTVAALRRHRLEFLPLHDPRYPALLRQIPDPPPWLFARGNLASLARPSVAMVGSRRASHAGTRAATEIAGHLVAAGYTVCSGLALGIDAAAHRGALQDGATVAVLASGIDRASPACHRSLLEQIEVDGCVISELPPGTAPTRWQFPRRNRIISGLAGATIIVEAALPSGSLHTATAALEQGREVFTLPWSIYHAQGAGCLRLLRDGATPITAMEELGDYFPGVRVAAVPRSTRAPQSRAGNDILDLIGDGSMALERLLQVTGKDSAQLLALLGEMELAGQLRCVDGTYQRADNKSCQPKGSC